MSRKSNLPAKTAAPLRWMTHDPDWHVSSLLTLPPEVRTEWLNSLTDKEAERLRFQWAFWARPEQLIPLDVLGNIPAKDKVFIDHPTDPVGGVLASVRKSMVLWLAGRGFGKTRALIEGLRFLIQLGYRRIALVGRTAADVRDVLVEGQSGVLNVFPTGERPIYEPSKRRLTFSNAAIITTYTADKPDQLRGPEHDAAVCDELAAWRYTEAFDNLMMGLRLGDYPICLAGTTPRPTRLIKELVADPTVYVIGGRTRDNAANLAPSFLDRMERKYAGTRLGLQELEGKILDDTAGALWTRGRIEALRVRKVPALVRVVVAIDPATTSNDESDETGIVVAGVSADEHVYVLEDLSLRGTPNEWASEAVAAYYKYKADRIIGEANNGGDMIEALIRAFDKDVSYKKVHASRGKQTRAEPVSALYEQGRAHHLGMFAELEDQMCTWLPTDADSPDRMDALVWAVTELVLEKQEPQGGAAKVRAGGLYGKRGRGR